MRQLSLLRQMRVSRISKVLSAAITASLLFSACGPGRGQNAGQSISYESVVDLSGLSQVNDSQLVVYHDEEFGVSACIENGIPVLMIDQEKLIDKDIMYEPSTAFGPNVTAHKVAVGDGLCAKVFIGDVGQDYNPMLFALMDDGTVRMMSIFKAIYTGQFSLGGAVPAAHGAVSFKSMGGGAYEIDGETAYSYSTVGAVKADGSITEIPVYLGDSRIQYETSNGVTHILAMSDDWKMSYIILDELELAVSYSGDFHLLREKGSESVYAYKFTNSERPSGDGGMDVYEELVEGEFSISRDDDGLELRVTPLRGLEFGTTMNKSAVFETSYWGE